VRRFSLEENYGVNLTVAICAIAPYIVVTTAFVLYVPVLIEQFKIERTGLEIVSGLSTAGYAFGALLAGDLIRRFVQRRLFYISESVFVIGCVLGATSQNIVEFGAGSVLMGFSTGLLLVAALPPVVQRYPADRLPNSAAWINIGFFGAVTAGPLIGGVVGETQLWRWFYGGWAAFGLANLLLSIITLPKIEPKTPDAPFDWHAVLLGLVATVLPFWAAGELIGHGFNSLLFMVPMAVGIACFVAMLLTQYHKEDALAPVKPMWSSIPLTGVIVATIGGGALVTLMELIEEAQITVLRRSPLLTGISFWPEVVGVMIAAILLGIMLRRSRLAVLPLAGMIVLIAAAALLAALPDAGPWWLVLLITGLLGIGAGATVSPGLWLAAFSLPSQLVGRTFALVELVRSEGDFILAPVLLQIAQIYSVAIPLTMNGIREAAFLTLLVTLFFTVLCIALWITGNAALRAANIERWLEEKETPAIASPPLGAAFGAKAPK
jgi:MFS family permease